MILVNYFKIFIIFIVSFANFTSANALEVQTLGQESCWYAQTDYGDFKVASFNNGDAFTLSYFQLEEIENRANRELSKQELGQPLHFETFLQCSAFGSALILNLKYEMMDLCVWAKVKNNQVEIISVGQSENAGFCHGINYRQIVLTVTDTDLAVAELKNSTYSQYINRYEKMGSNYLIIYLEKESYHLTTKIVQEINGEEKFEWLKKVDLDYYNHPIGEFTQLNF